MDYALLAPFLLFLGLQVLVFLTANALVWRLFSEEVRDFLDYALLLFVLAVAEILSVSAFWGFLGFFNILPISLTILSLFFLANFRFFGISWQKLRSLFYRKSPKFPFFWILGIFGFFVLFGTVELFSSFFQYPWEYDSLAYHMPMVVEWLKSGNLWTVFYAAFGGPLGYYPANHELLMAWLSLPFGQDYFANAANFFFAVILIIAVYKLLKSFKVSDFLSWLGGALIISMPIFLRQIGTEQVDLFLALMVTLSWYFVLRTFQRKDGVLFLPAVLSISIMLGSKYLALLYGIPILVVFFMLFRYWKQYSKYWLITTIVVLGTLGSMWYWRNFVLTQNPVFPAGVKIGNFTLFEGYRGLLERVQELSLWKRLSDPAQFFIWVQTMIKETGLYLYLMIGAYAVLIIELLVKLCFKSFAKGEGQLMTILLFLVPLYLLMYFISPYSASMMEHNVRYAMPWIILAVVMILVTVQKLGFWKKPILVFFVVMLWWQLLTVMPSLRLGTQPFLDLFFVHRFPLLFLLFLGFVTVRFFSFELWKERSWGWIPATVVSLSFFFFFFQNAIAVRTELRSEVWQRKYHFPLMKAYEWLDKNTPANATVASSLSPLYYPLYGPTFQKKVGYVNINDCNDCDYGDFHQKSLGVRDNPDVERWKENLKTFGAQYLVLGYTFEGDVKDVVPYELDWVLQNPRNFQKVFAEDKVAVYKISL